MKNRLNVLSFILISLVLLLAGCGNSNETGNSDSNSDKGVVELTIWHMEEPPNRVEVFNQVIENFNSENPDIKVNAQVQSWDDAYSKFPAAIQAGNGPDLLFTLPDYTTLIKDLEVIQPMDDIVAALDEKHDFIDASLDPYQYDDHTWAVPIYGFVQALWYRKDMFEEANIEPPATWDELTAAAKALTKDGVHGIALPASKSQATDQVLYSFLVSGGAKNIIDGENNITFNTPETINTYKKYVELLQYSPVDSNTYTWGEPQAQFNSGKVVMAIEKGQYLAPFEEESGLSADQLGVVPMPIAENGEAGSIYYSNGIMMLTDDEKKQEAVEKFLTYLYEPENYTTFVNAEPGLFLPVTTTGVESDFYWENPIISKYSEQLNVLIEASQNGALFGFTNGVSSEIGQITGPNIISQTLEQITVNDMSVEEAVEWGQQQMEAAVQE